jgi:hypothetical protein
MDDGHHARTPEPTNTAPGLIYMLSGPRGTAILIRPDWSSLDDCLALRGQMLRPARRHKRRRRLGGVRWHSLRLSAHRRYTMNRNEYGPSQVAISWTMRYAFADTSLGAGLCRQVLFDECARKCKLGALGYLEGGITAGGVGNTCPVCTYDELPR